MATPEKVEFDGRNVGKISSGKSSFPNNGGNMYSQHRRASLGAYYARESMRRNSIEKLDSANNSQKSIPHYLRASTGSCHDFCKYGRKPAFEAKERRSIPKRTAKPPSSEQNSVEKTVSGEQKKKIVVNHKAPSGTKSRLPEHKPSPDAKSFSPKPTPSLYTKMYSAEQKASSGYNIHIRRHKPSSSRNTPSTYTPEIIKREIVFPSKNAEVPPKQDSSIHNKVLESEKKTENVFNKHSPSVKLKSVMVRASSSSNTSDGIHGKGRRNNDIKTGGKMLASIASVKKALAPLPASVSPKIYLRRTPSLKSRKIIRLKVLSPLKDRNRIHKAQIESSSDEKIPEKTLHVIRTDSPVIQSRSSPSTILYSSVVQSPSLLCHEEEEAEYDETEVDELISDSNDTAEVGKVVKEKHIKVLRKSTAVGSDNKDSTPMKLNFRRGKVVDLKSNNNNPRRLRFRKGRVLAEDQDGNGDFGRKTFKNGMVNDDKNDADPSSDKIALKHQDVQGKRDLQGLFNDVIEETANKLVQSRKSKVKALVGAFETVISLQECKPPFHDAK